MFYTNAFVNLNLPATVLSLLSRTWILYLYLCPLCISTSHRWQSAVCCCWRWRSSPQHSIWPTSQLLLIPGQTSGAGYREIPPFSNILWILWLIPNWLCSGNLVKAWMRDLTLHSGVSTLRLGEWEEVCPEYYRYYDGDMSQDGCDQSEQASFSAWLSFLVVGSNATESIDNGRFFQKWYQIKFSSYIHYPQSAAGIILGFILRFRWKKDFTN